MRDEREMLDLILTYARDHEDIRVVIMNGSRVNPNANKDPFQDYDIVYYVRKMDPFLRNMDIPRFFGEIMIMELPEDMIDPPPKNDGSYGYLMQFKDGNRIDLGISPVETLNDHLDDSLSLVLLDKDGLIKELPSPSDCGYYPSKPSAKLYEDCCNEFWWLNPYVAKGLWRGELTYARYMLDTLLRGQLMKMLTWYFGIQTGFQKSAGKQGKYLREHIGSENWGLLVRTFVDAQLDHNWEALFLMVELFRKTARCVAQAFDFSYPEMDDVNVSTYIRQIQLLPRDAEP
jgi:aminoglycoside 6-adenylyltransferase